MAAASLSPKLHHSRLHKGRSLVISGAKAAERGRFAANLLRMPGQSRELDELSDVEEDELKVNSEELLMEANTD